MNARSWIHVGLAALVLGFVALRPVRSVNRVWQDRLAALAPSGTPTGDVVVVGISDADIQHFGPWPWDRSVTAKLFAGVAAAGPKVMAFDGFFPHRSVGQPGDTVLAQTLERIAAEGKTKVVLPFQFSGVRNDPALDAQGLRAPELLQTSPIQMLTDLPGLKAAPYLRSEAILWGDSAYQKSSAPAGHIHSSADPEDGTYRRNLYVVRHGDDFMPSVVVALLAAWKDASLSEVSLSPEAVRIKELSIPLDRYGYAPLRWIGPPGSVPTLSATQVLEDPKAAEKLKGKIVIIGVTSAAALNRETGDFFRTPVADRFPGVEIWGVALENVLQGQVPVSPGWLRLVELALALGLAAAAWALLGRLGWRPKVQGIVLGGLAGILVLLVVLEYALSIRTALDLPLLGAFLGLGGVWAFRLPRNDEASQARPAAAGFVPPGQAASAPAPDDGKQRIGKFEIVKELGRGAMGVVYDGYDDGLDRHVAIKVIIPERRLGERPEESLERFKREARAIAALNHPSIVTIFESGQWQDSHYIAMEFLRGRGLDEIMALRRLTWKEIHELGAQMLSGLGYAHAQGVVHRDIKPANIMVVDEGKVAKITDFGLARKGDASMSLTQEGTVLGTPYYMAPEQVEGKRTDAHSDQFSLGLVLFEMLAGEKAYDGEDVRSIMLKILIQPPKSLAPHLQDDVPTAVLDIVETLLQKDPTQRFPTLQEALAAWNRLPV